MGGNCGHFGYTAHLSFPFLNLLENWMIGDFRALFSWL